MNVCYVLLSDSVHRSLIGECFTSSMSFIRHTIAGLRVGSGRHWGVDVGSGDANMLPGVEFLTGVLGTFTAECTLMHIGGAARLRQSRGHLWWSVSCGKHLIPGYVSGPGFGLVTVARTTSLSASGVMVGARIGSAATCGVRPEDKCSGEGREQADGTFRGVPAHGYHFPVGVGQRRPVYLVSPIRGSLSCCDRRGR